MGPAAFTNQGANARQRARRVGECQNDFYLWLVFRNTKRAFHVELSFPCGSVHQREALGTPIPKAVLTQNSGSSVEGLLGGTPKTCGMLRPSSCGVPWLHCISNSVACNGHWHANLAKGHTGRKKSLLRYFEQTLPNQLWLLDSVTKYSYLIYYIYVYLPSLNQQDELTPGNSAVGLHASCRQEIRRSFRHPHIDRRVGCALNRALVQICRECFCSWHQASFAIARLESAR